jgi:hypothetical protein
VGVAHVPQSTSTQRSFTVPDLRTAASTPPAQLHSPPLAPSPPPREANALRASQTRPAGGDALTPPSNQQPEGLPPHRAAERSGSRPERHEPTTTTAAPHDEAATAATPEEGVVVPLPPVEPRRRFPGTIRMFNTRPRSLSLAGGRASVPSPPPSVGDAAPRPLPVSMSTTPASAPSSPPRCTPNDADDSVGGSSSGRAGRWGLLGASWDYLGSAWLGAGGGGSAIVEDAVSITVRPPATTEVERVECRQGCSLLAFPRPSPCSGRRGRES